MAKLKFNPGVHQISNDEYHSSEGISRSALMAFMKSPYHFWYQYLNPDYVAPEETTAKIFGNLFHTLVLEPHKFQENYVISPKFDRRTKKGKEDYESFLIELNQRILVSEEQYENAKRMAESIRTNSFAFELIENARYEHSIYFSHESTGLLCKARPDVWHENLIVDLKTSSDASYKSFQSSAYKYGYYLQAGMMHEACKSIGQAFQRFVFVVLEKEPPHSLAIYALDDEGLQFGIRQFHSCLEKLAMCFDKNEWPGYGIKTLAVPSYAHYELELLYDE